VNPLETIFSTCGNFDSVDYGRALTGTRLRGEFCFNADHGRPILLAVAKRCRRLQLLALDRWVSPRPSNLIRLCGQEKKMLPSFEIVLLREKGSPALGRNFS
jgi:hypothetical protein